MTGGIAGGDYFDLCEMRDLQLLITLNFTSSSIIEESFKFGFSVWRLMLVVSKMYCIENVFLNVCIITL